MRLTRREVIKLSAATSASLLLGWRPDLLFAQDLLTRPIPSTGESVPVVGIGGRNYRVGPSAEVRAPFKATLQKFAELGGKIVDTAPSYGNSERVFGDLMSELEVRSNLFVATKVDRRGRQAGIEGMEQSLEYLRTDRVDLMQVHNLIDTETQLATCREWKAQGRIRYLGITTSSTRQYDRFLQVMNKEPLDFIQVNYSLGARDAAERILPLARDRGIAVLVNLPFGRGRLFNRVGERPLPGWAREIDCETWAQVFLKYVTSHPAVTCAIPGTTKVRHAVDNMGAARGTLPDQALRRRIMTFYDAL